MSAVPRLTPELPTELEGRLVDQGAPIKEAFAPGLSDAEMDAAVQPLGLTLPVEARVWWGWHNGFVAGTDPYRGKIGPGIYLVS